VRHIFPQLCAQLSFISLSLILVSTSYGQVRSPINRVQQSLPSREQSVSNLRIDANRTERELERDKRILLVTLKEDFRQLQIVELDLMKRIFCHSANEAVAISRKEIRASLGEIQNRAQRLKTNFRLPEVKSDKRAKEGASQFAPSSAQFGTLSEGLLILDRTVMKFVENPIFQQLKVLDAELSLQAAQDLNKILHLTDSLRKLAKQDQENPRK
jgi:hypothetical protein